MSDLACVEQWDIMIKLWLCGRAAHQMTAGRRVRCSCSPPLRPQLPIHGATSTISSTPSSLRCSQLSEILLSAYNPTKFILKFQYRHFWLDGCGPNFLLPSNTTTCSPSFYRVTSSHRVPRPRLQCNHAELWTAKSLKTLPLSLVGRQRY